MGVTNYLLSGMILQVVGNEGPSTFTLKYWGFIPSVPTKGQLVMAKLKDFTNLATLSCRLDHG